MSEGVLVLEPGDERAKKIGKAMANKSATAILSILKEGDLTLSEISEKMDQPMTTAKYHVENLLDAELIEVRKVKYSEKGREVKVYGVSERLVIVAPLGGDIKGTLLKYASVFTMLILATLALVAVSPSFGMFGSPDMMYSQVYVQTPDTGVIETTAGADGENLLMTVSDWNRTAKTAPSAAVIPPDNQTNAYDSYMLEAESYGAGSVAEESPLPAATGPDTLLHQLIIAFFLGGCLILAVMLIYEVFVWKQEKRFWDNIGGKDK